MGDYFNPDLETTALLRVVENDDIVSDCMKGKHSADGETAVLNELERLGWDADVINDVSLFKCYDTITSLKQAGLGSVTKDTEEFSRLKDYISNKKGKNCCDISSASVPGRRKFVILKLPDFSKLLERCT